MGKVVKSRVIRKCLFCKGTVLKARWDTGRHYCMTPECIAQGDEFRRNFRLILVPKQGFTWVRNDDPVLAAGKSSGRSN